jgi:hypothetical protein
MPAGSRVHAGRPLCLRCTQIGLQEGWAQSQEQMASDRLLYTTTRKPGIMVLAFFVSVLGFVIWATLMLIKR